MITRIDRPGPVVDGPSDPLRDASLDARCDAPRDPLSDRPTVVVRTDGSIGIPRGIRNALLLDPGERVSLGFEQGVLTVRPLDAWDASRASSGGVSRLDREIDDFLRRRRRRTPT